MLSLDLPANSILNGVDDTFALKCIRVSDAASNSQKGTRKFFIQRLERNSNKLSTSSHDIHCFVPADYRVRSNEFLLLLAMRGTGNVRHPRELDVALRPGAEAQKIPEH